MKTCTKCGVKKEFSEFHKNKIGKDGLQHYCKECQKKRRQELKTDKKLQLKRAIRRSVILENKILAKENKKLCSGCKNIFFIDELVNKTVCKVCNNECTKKNNKKYQKTDKCKERRRKYQKTDKCKEYMREYNRKYYLKQKQLKEQKQI